MPPVDVSLIMLGCVGGLLPDVLRVVKGRYDELPGYFRRLNFWLGLVLVIALGGFLAWIAEAKAAKEALAYGFGGPAVVTKLLAASPSEKPTRGATFSLRTWWAR